VSEGKPSLIQLSANASYNHVILSVRTIGVGNRLQGAADEKEYEIDKIRERMREIDTCFMIANCGIESFIRKSGS
jgi:hypothetical protein